MHLEAPLYLAEKLGSYELSSGGWEHLQQFIDALPGITSAQVQKAMRDSVRNIDFAVLGDLSRIDRALLESM